MKLILSSICISSLVLANFSLLPQATAQCLTKNDDLSRVTGSIDLSGILEFNLRLFRELIPTESKRNFVFSAYSIWNALSLAYLGSSGGQEQQLRIALGLEDKLSTLQKWRALEYLYKRRPQTSVNNTFITVNRAYFDQKIEVRACMEDIFHNEIEKLDFTKPQRAADHINAFVSEITKGNIKELVSAADVDHARLVLANAAYFKGTWNSTFNKQNTKRDTFTAFDGNHYTVDMMQQTGDFNYVFSDQLKAAVLELPYAGPSISMLLFLPVNPSLESFNNLLRGMSTNNFEAVINKLQASNKSKIKVNLPVFSLETQCGDELILALKSMGITDLFSPTKADFTAVTLDRSIFIDKSIHKAFIKVNEEGTEAGASTTLVATKIGPTSFECRRPFLFAILDKETENLLFMGVYKTPESKLPPLANDQSFEDTFPEQNKNDQHFTDTLPIAPIPGRDNEYVPIRPSNPNPKPINSLPGLNFDFSKDQFPNPSSDRVPAFFENQGLTPGRRTNINQVQNIPSFTEGNGFLSTGVDSNQNPNRNVLSRGDGEIFVPGRVSTLNSEKNIPSSGDSGILSPGGNSNLNPDRTIPSIGDERVIFTPGRGSFPNQDRNIPSLGVFGIVAPSSASNLLPVRNIPSTGDSSIPVHGRGSNLNPNRNIPLVGEERVIFTPGRGSFQNPDQNIPSLGVFEIVPPSSASNLLPDRNIPSTGDSSIPVHGRGLNLNPNRNIPLVGEERGILTPNRGSNLNPDHYTSVSLSNQDPYNSHINEYREFIPSKNRNEEQARIYPVFIENSSKYNERG